MWCVACGHENPATNRFCGGCGAALSRVCPACAHVNPPDHQFCGACGASLKEVESRQSRVKSGEWELSTLNSRLSTFDSQLAGSTQPAAGSASSAPPLATSNLTTNTLSEARKVVTIVFADLIGSTALHERLDAESVRRVMDHYYRALQSAVEAHRGTVVKLLGDGVMAAFGVPRVAEDDAIRAVRAAVEMVQAVRVLGNLCTGFANG